MKHPSWSPDWPASWRQCYAYDKLEVFGDLSHRGYAYAYQNRRAAALQLLVEGLKPGARILDVAAAQGNFSIALAEMGYRVTWNDLRQDLVGYVQAKHEYGDLAFAPGNAFELDFDERFDAVLATEVIEHVAHPDAFLRQLATLVKPGGHIVITTPNGGYFRNRLPRFSDCPDPSQFEAIQFGPDGDDHIFLLHADEIERFAAAASLAVERLSLFTTPLTNGHVKLEPVLHVLPRRLVDAIERLGQRAPAAWARRLMVHTATRLRVQA
jgi:2-polyprenyl-3-methyl-5-hydroxy-6-metoxy-1,4-benzoquinol methylase